MLCSTACIVSTAFDALLFLANLIRIAGFVIAATVNATFFFTDLSSGANLVIATTFNTLLLEADLSILAVFVFATTFNTFVCCTDRSILAVFVFATTFDTFVCCADLSDATNLVEAAAFFALACKAEEGCSAIAIFFAGEAVALDTDLSSSTAARIKALWLFADSRFAELVVATVIIFGTGNAFVFPATLSAFAWFIGSTFALDAHFFKAYFTLVTVLMSRTGL